MEISNEEFSKTQQDFKEMNSILFGEELDYKVSPKLGTITIMINGGSNRQLILEKGGTWRLD